MIIAIDGPAGAGKSTVSKLLAKKKGFLYIDTGAMYRALTLKAITRNISATDPAKLIKLSQETEIDLKNESDGTLKVFLDGLDVTIQIREPRISRLVSDIAKIEEIRRVMVKLQRKLGALGECVLDGRDIGTVVFPDADRKFYIDAQFSERVRRRYDELKASGANVSMADVEADLQNRDTIDSTRRCAPLKKAEDAIYVDTTDMTIDEVVDTLLKHIEVDSQSG